MEDAKILEALDLYEKFLKGLSVTPRDYPHGDVVFTQEDRLGHVLGMIPQMRQFLKEERREKVMRWLGFIQGVLWAEQLFTLDALKNHNRA